MLCPSHACSAQGPPPALPHDMHWVDDLPARWDAFPRLDALLDPAAKPTWFQPPSWLVDEQRPPPPAYAKIRASEWLAPQPGRPRDPDPCRCKGEDCGEDCDNRATGVECGAANCLVERSRKDAARCSNRALQRGGRRKDCVPFYTGPCGHGLRVCGEVRAGELLIEYVGEILDVDMLEARLAMQHDNPAIYYMELSRRPLLFIDARNKGNASRFANHSCDASAVLQRWEVAGVTRVGSFVRRRTRPRGLTFRAGLFARRALKGAWGDCAADC
jgi:hypothetical protein